MTDYNYLIKDITVWLAMKCYKYYMIIQVFNDKRYDFRFCKSLSFVRWTGKYLLKMPHYNTLVELCICMMQHRAKQIIRVFMKSKKKRLYLGNVMVYSFRTVYHVETIHRHVIFDFTNVKNVLFENFYELPFVIISHSKIFKRFNSH